MELVRTCKRLSVALGVGGYLFLATAGAQANTLNLRDVPLFLNETAPPLNMLVMGRDHKLYYEAYNDASDLNGDGQLDAGYKPAEITYFGLFDSFVCYSYSGARFVPNRLAPDKRCGNTAWSGDFLNYVTTSRFDALRKVLYGGKRSQDPATGSVELERTLIPQDAHSWGKEYQSVAVDGYDIRDYTPLALPTPNRRHLFANTTLLGQSTPLMRLLPNMQQRIWEWVSIERPVAGSDVQVPGSPTARTNVGGSIQDFTVRVLACVPGVTSTAEAANCRTYTNGSSKPIGLLQRYGENDAMKFGLITGSYENNTEGGVLRRNIGSIRDEVDLTTGQFRTTDPLTGTAGWRGVIRTIDAFAVLGFGGGHQYSCGWSSATRPINPGECRMWGNPVGEMLYEAMRYYADRGSPTGRFATALTDGESDQQLGLPRPGWEQPWTVHPRCSKPFVTVISDVNPSYDMDSMPGSPWNTLGSNDLTGFDATARLNTISANEPETVGTKFIGEVFGGSVDGAPTPKSVTSLAQVRGLAPEEPTKRGGYSSAAVAYFGNTVDLRPSVPGDQKPQTFAVALASPLPRIEIPFGPGREITLVPFAKSVGGFGIRTGTADFQPTNQIVDFYFDRLQSVPNERYVFRINYEDVEQGADHDMDAIVEYDIQKIPNTNRISVTLRSTYAAGSITQHMGYVISGTDGRDGIYLEVRDADTANVVGGSDNQDKDYFLDTPPVTLARPNNWFGTATWNDGVALPLVAVREFEAGTTAGAELLRDPLFYAAKWGGFVDGNGNSLPDDESEWNQDRDTQKTPDNYFLVTNALKLADQLGKAFDTIVARSTSASSVALNSGSLSEETRVYQAKFNSGDWTGQLLSFKINANGSVPTASEWDAATALPAASARTILTMNSAGTPIPFRWNSLDSAQQSALATPPDTLGPDRLAYLRGDATRENTLPLPVGIFRARPVKLGDIVASSPVFVGRPRAVYRDNLEGATNLYSTFRASMASRTPMVYAGANDGMIHGFDANNGRELMAYVPRAVFPNLRLLTQPGYPHKFYVDGSPTAVDAFVNGSWRTVLTGGLNLGGQAVYALDVTNPGAFSEVSPSSVVMWEFDDRDVDGPGPDTGDPDLGFTYSRPAVVKLRTGPWAAVFGNGYNNTALDGSVSATGNAVLFVVGLNDGRVVRKIDTGVGRAQDPLGQNRPNGLASVTAVDFDQDDIVDYVYAGDLFGNLWKFDFTAGSASSWDVEFIESGVKRPLFVAVNDANQRQPITSRPVVGRGPRGNGLLVLFGTGKYLEPQDKDRTLIPTQTFYGLYDRNTGTSTDRMVRADLLVQQITTEETNTYNGTPVTVRVTTENRPTTASRGWRLDLTSPKTPQGEMQVSDAILRSGRVLFTTLIPSADPCSFGGDSWLMALDAMSGARVSKSQFDLNYDGQFDGADGSTASTPVTGIKSDLGIINRPGILADNQSDVEYIVASGTGGKSPQGVEGGRSVGGADRDLTVDSDGDGDAGNDDDDPTVDSDGDGDPTNDGGGAAANGSTRGKTGEFDRGRQSWRQLR